MVAEEIRRDIRRRVDDGQSDLQISDALVSAYGESVDLRPQSGGIVGLIWILPVVVMVFGFAALAAVFQRWKTTEAKLATDADVALVEQLRGRKA